MFASIYQKRSKIKYDKTAIQYFKTAIQHKNVHSSIAIHFFSLIADPGLY